LGLPSSPERDREIGLRFDQHAGPAQLLEMPSLRAFDCFVGSDLDEEPALFVTEERTNGLLFLAL
jgi:hypothetical protein